MSKKPIYAAIDAGGTSLKCMLADKQGNIIAKTSVPTTSPNATLHKCVEFFQSFADLYNIKSLGIASFGPIDIDTNSNNYGMFLPGPKPDWDGVNLFEFFTSRLGVPVIIDTDVNGALLAEKKWGNAKNCSSAAYITIGTGIGAGILCGGKLAGKPFHPEFGHIRIERHKYDLDFVGVCNIHGDCLEGLACGPSIHARFGKAETLPDSHKVWDIISFYLAQACLSLSLSFRPQVIILGGGVMQSEHLLAKIHTQYEALINSYIGQSRQDIENFILLPKLGNNAGVWGGVYLAQSGL